MGARSAELVRLGMLLRDLAVKHNLAVVVSNQVADRFGVGSPVLTRTQPTAAAASRTTKMTPGLYAAGDRATMHAQQESPLAARSRNPARPPPPPLPPLDEPTSSIAAALSSLRPASPHDQDDHDDGHEPSPRTPAPPPHDDDDRPAPGPPALSLDHQQRWFTGWGDDPAPASAHGMKTPSLGLVWATQVACRVALFKAPRYGRSRFVEDDGDGERVGGVARRGTTTTWRRWAKVIYAPHAAPMGPGLEGAVEFEIGRAGVGSVVRKEKGKGT